MVYGAWYMIHVKVNSFLGKCFNRNYQIEILSQTILRNGIA